MPSGIPFSDREKAYILEKAYQMSWQHIAKDLAELFSEDNGGVRSWKSVRSFMVRYQKQSDRDPYIPVPIHRDVITLAIQKGFRKTDISTLLLEHLKGVP